MSTDQGLNMPTIFHSKLNKIISLCEKYEELLAQENDMEENYHQQKKLDEKIVHIWNTLSGQQQVEMWKLIPKDFQNLLDVD